jgi:cell fate regulator YaaT (PSP1 superfamily)
MSDSLEANPDFPPEETPPPPTVNVVSVRFRTGGKAYRFDAGGLVVNGGDRVLVHTERGQNLGTVVARPQAVDVRQIRSSLPRVIRRADQRDLAREEANLRRAQDAQRICLHRIRERNLPMKVIKTECAFDGARVTVHFYSEDRIDFRDLVRDLTQTLHSRIEMRQVGPRDETRMVGGIGPCGRELCCSSWLRDFNAVSVKMAKAQGLSLNPSKLAGMCGRLKCCLRYEYDTYLELGRALPSIGSKVESVKGNGTVARQNLLAQTVVIRRHDDGTEVEAALTDLVQKK